MQNIREDGGRIRANYAYKSPMGGRRYAKQPFASQNLPRCIREEVFASTTLEVDMVNAFPCLLGKLVAKVCGKGYAEKMAPGLLEYNARRNEVLEEISEEVSDVGVLLAVVVLPDEPLQPALLVHGVAEDGGELQDPLPGLPVSHPVNFLVITS